MEYEISGGSFPIVVCTLQKGETMKNETGAMAFMTSGMNMDTNTGGGLLKGIGRALSGDTLFLNFFTAESDGEQIGFSACTPGKIIPIKLDGSNTIIGQKNAFLAAEESVEVDIYFKNKLGTGIFGGEGFILQKFTGNGMVFLEVDGDPIEKTLAPGEVIKVDTGNVVAFEPSVSYEIETVKGLGNIFLGGEGLFLTKLVGPGKVILQSQNFGDFAGRVINMMPKRG